MDPRFQAIREECCEANRQLPKTGLVDLTFGNVSVLDRDARVFAIKPSGVPYGELRPEHMVLVDLEGKVVEGDLRPSSDTPTHRCLFRSFGNIRSVVHTHSRYAVSFAQAQKPIPCLGTTHADHFYGPVPVTRLLTPEEVESAYEWETGVVIAELFRQLDPDAVPGVLVAQHGPFAWGPSGPKAVENAQALEIVAQMALQALQIEAAASILPDHILNKHYSRKHGPAAYYGQK
ncbi:MAG: putative Class II Aldolase and Adducin N-terminal domain [Puniceicoccaceae bacterium 5H]|nr:MAG: putative Class II Aldolase and Adducin N-terminal domain [Puniceicoccaceae bacterium 5H]